MQLTEQIPLNETGILPALIADYLAGKPSLSHLYKYTPDISSFKKVIADKKKDKTDRKLLTDVLLEQYKDIPTTDAVKSNITSLLSEKTFTVVAAHQPCLFFGPLYNIYKVSCAIKLAGELKQAYPDYNFVPVFWMGSEDHDIEELNHAYINGKKVQWAGPTSGAVGRIKSTVITTALEELKTLCGENDVVKMLEKGIEKYQSFGNLTQYLVNEIFKQHGLVVLDQDDAKLKQKFSEVILDELLYSRATDVLKENINFLAANYKAQAKTRDINFFYLGPGFRERILYNNERQEYTVNNRGMTFTKSDIMSEVSNYPENFSPNVIFRPLYQEMILPNLAFVGGAGELSYWLELKPLFDYYRVNFPALMMRNSAVILNASTINKLNKLGLGVKNFFGDIESTVKDYIIKNAGAEASLNGHKEEIAKLFDAISAKAEAVDITLGQSVAAEKQKAVNALENLEAKMLKAEKRKQETAVNQIRAIHAVLFPTGELQERVENFAPLYNENFISDIIGFFNPLLPSFYIIAH